MMEPIEHCAAFEEDEFIAAFLLYSEKKRRSIYFLICFCLVAAASGACIPEASPYVFWTPIAIALGAYLSIPISEKNLRRVYREQLAVYGEITTEFAETGYHCLGERTEWASVRGWKETEEFFLLAEKTDRFCLLVKRGFRTPEDIDAFRTILQEKIGSVN